MAAYGALVSLSHILHHILHPPPLNNITIDSEPIDFLRGKVDFLLDFLETYNPRRRSQEIEDVETRIADAASEAEDIIESNVVDQILATGGENNFIRLCGGIQTVLEKFLSIEKELVEMRNMQGVGDLQPKRLATATSTRSLPGGKITMVGFEEHMNEIMGALSTDESNRQIITIVGMGGIGKTTLATAVYNNPFIIEHFHVRAWVTVSQKYTVRELLLRLLSEITKAGQNKQESTDDEIGELLYKELFDRKYLIVMDDMWDIQAWDQAKRFLPRNENGSRILVTTRLSNLANDFRSCRPHQIDLLDEEKSWDLLRGKVFGKEDCPVELEGIGKNIAKKCGGLPLALVVIGGFLAKSEMTKEHWGSVEGDVTSDINCLNDKQLMNILSLSYSHLPIYLKPCFLYLAVFPEDFEIPVSPLVKLWVAEGLIKPNPTKSLEEVALEYLEDLISRNLILVHRRGSRGKVKFCMIHDLLRDLCIRQAEKEKFVDIVKLDNPNFSTNIKTKRRLSISSPSKPLDKTVLEALQSARFNRVWLSRSLSLRHFRRDQEEVGLVNKIIHGFRLLKLVHVEDPEIQIDIPKLINLRCVVADSVSSLSSMSLCWNLQTIVCRKSITLPAEIWQMPQFRHLKIGICALPDPPDDQSVIVLENLQTLARVENFKCTEQVVNRIPSLKKLVIGYEDPKGAASNHLKHAMKGQKVENCPYDSTLLVARYCLKNLVYFKKLESLGIMFGGKLWTGIAFPISLKKLTLSKCWIPWEDLSIVGKLPNLEVLKLYFHATKGEEWNPIEGEFCQLKFLLICFCKMKIWRAENYHFPCLEHLVLGFVHGLDEIPTSFAEILTLQVIELTMVKHSVWSSAKEISDERELLGYEPLHIGHYEKYVKIVA